MEQNTVSHTSITARQITVEFQIWHENEDNLLIWQIQKDLTTITEGMHALID